MEETNEMFFKAVIAEKIERYDQVIEYLAMTLPQNDENKENVKEESRNWTQNKLELLTVSYKNLINSNRDNLQKLIKNKKKETDQKIVDFYVNKLIREIFKQTSDFMEFLENAQEFFHAEDDQTMCIQCTKLIGDNYRYKCEILQLLSPN